MLACSSEIDGKPAATVGNSTVQGSNEAENKAVATQDDTTFSLHSDSKIEWVGNNLKSDHTGGFKDIKGTAIVGKEGNLKSVNADINILSLFSDNKKLTRHLLNEDFFFSSKYTKATFKSSSITEKNIKGNLEMRGITKEIEFPATVAVATDKVTLTGEFTINRKLWGINYAGAADNLIKDDVLIKLDVTYAK